MRVLVTGGAGFVGSHLVEVLVANGYDVAIIDSMSKRLPRGVSTSVKCYEQDVRQPLEHILLSFRPDVIAHLAAQVSVPASMSDPGADMSINVGGVISVMKAAARAKVRKVVAVSSAAVYGTPQALPLTESSPSVPLSPYGLSKLTGERYISLLGEAYGVAHTIIRPSNIYGPFQTTEGEGAVVPAFLNRFLKGEDPTIQGDGSQTRDFVYVKDMVRAVVSALTRADGTVLNVSSGVQTSVIELWTILARMLGWQREPVYAPPRNGDIRHSVMANEAAKHHLNWHPVVSLEEGLKETINWATGLAEVAASRERV